ncbi:MAG TPA: c-type cytochrome [Aquabacterium sp.]|uniref:c-type cytochrome n=1 Tax=Aquabacterium sp. TaxID=1872578 RepID=UPI002E37CAB9|nr:c-type cytochrome [Aquabacterium sp.]HEX5372636.1 c-type cytochrome [Aquabacterium sp.]
MSIRSVSMVLLAGIALMACSKQDTPASAADTAASTSAAVPEVAASATETAPAAASSTAASVATAEAPGLAVFNRSCAACHTAGVMGAPKPGDKADWAPRIAQGQDTLYKHALEGFNGKKGAMPARGGNTALSDAEVKAAVDHMVALSR